MCSNDFATAFTAAFEDWGDSPKNHKPLKDITYDQVVALNGKHIIYGIVETFEQDKTKYLEWYDRRVVTYSWEWHYLVAMS